MLHTLLIPMQTLTEWFSAQTSSVSAVVKTLFTFLVLVFFGYKVFQAKFALSVIAVAVIACSLFMWMVDYGGMAFIAKLVQNQSKS